MPKPKPKRGSAEEHRQESDEEGDSGDVDTVEMPEDAAEVQTTEDADGSVGTVLPNLPYRKIAIAGAAAITVYMAWRYYNRQTAAQRQLEMARQQEAAQRDDVQQNSEPAGPDIPQDPNDPLASDEAAGGRIFDGWEGK